MYRATPLSKDYNYLEYSKHTVSITYLIVQNSYWDGPNWDDDNCLKVSRDGPKYQIKGMS